MSSRYLSKQLSELDLIKLCKKGDRKAQRTLFDVFGGRLMTVARRYGRTNEEAEDILQESYIRIFNNLSSFKNEGSLFAWLKVITVNTALHVLKKKYNRIVSDELHEFDGCLPLADVSTLQQLHVKDLLAIINKLPLGYRSVFNLYEIEGYSHKEIASMLNITESTSRSQLTKSKRMLKTLLPIENKVWDDKAV